MIPLDARAALRRLVRSPGQTLAAVLTVALAVGPCAAVFSVVAAVVLTPLPYRGADRLVWIWGTSDSSVTERVSPPDLLDLAARCEEVERLAGLWSTEADLHVGPEPERVRIAAVTEGFFEVLGVKPAIGRHFVAGEYARGRNGVAVLSDALWRTRFGSDPDIVGRPVRVPLGRFDSYTVVGVMPPGFGLLPSARRPSERPAIWLPLDLSEANMQVRRFRLLRLVGRLAPNATSESAQGQVGALAARLAREHPDSNRGWSVRVVPMRDELIGGAGKGLGFLAAAALLLLLVAGANYAILSLQRALDAERDAAIRVALGADSGRLMRGAAAEQAVLAVSGGLLATLLAAWSVKLCLVFAPPDIPRLDEVAITAGVGAFALGLACLLGAVGGLLPSWRVLRSPSAGCLGLWAPSPGSGARGRLLGVLVTAEVALTVVVLVGVASSLTSLARLLRTDPGFDPSNVLTMRFSLQPCARGGELVEAVAALPSVRMAATGGRLPFDEARSMPFAALGDGDHASSTGSAFFRAVSPGYFETLGIPLVEGRLFSPEDRAQAPRVAVASDSLARRIWPGQSAVGRSIRIDAFEPVVVEIVGVVGSVRETSLASDPGDALYVPAEQWCERRTTLLVRSEGDPLRLIAPVKRAVRDVAGEVSIHDVVTMEQTVADSVAPQRFVLRLLAILGGLALALAVVGVFGVVSFWAAQRRHEVGVRLAFGANGMQVAWMLVGRVMAYVGVGAAVGGIAVAFGGRLASHWVAELGHVEVTTLIGVAILVGLAALAAGGLPAWRSGSLDPMDVLGDAPSGSRWDGRRRRSMWAPLRTAARATSRRPGRSSSGRPGGGRPGG